MTHPSKNTGIFKVQFGAAFLPKSLWLKKVNREGKKRMQTGFSLTAAHL